VYFFSLPFSVTSPAHCKSRWFVHADDTDKNDAYYAYFDQRSLCVFYSDADCEFIMWNNFVKTHQYFNAVEDTLETMSFNSETTYVSSSRAQRMSRLVEHNICLV
jgi:hypothetical protein